MDLGFSVGTLLSVVFNLTLRFLSHLLTFSVKPWLASGFLTGWGLDLQIFERYNKLWLT